MILANNIGMTILSIVVFILCLSVVVCLHELGHFITAKICNIYCEEFSIGFGPAIFKKKFKHRRRKNKQYVDQSDELGDKVEGETTFSIRLLPLGGYVAMAEDVDNLTDSAYIVPKERTLNGVNHFKQICIMLAGIAVNLLLAWVLFFCCFAFCFQQRAVYEKPLINVVDESSLAYKESLRTGDQIKKVKQTYYDMVQLVDGKEVPYQEPIVFEPASEIKTYSTFDNGKDRGTILTQDKYSLSYQIQDISLRRLDPSYSKEKEDEFYKDELSSFKNIYASKKSYRKIEMKVISANGEEKDVTIDRSVVEEKTLSNSDMYYSFEKIGISSTIQEYRVGFLNAFNEASSLFNNLFVNIFVSLGSIFTPQGWQNVGGIISVYKVSAAGFTSGSVGYFIKLWGFISLNLGCFNLLPFPGLDGWQTLLALGETVTRKKIPSKVKNIANSIGLIVLMGLALLLIIKDIAKPISMLIFL